jgi:hypothetical protein
VNDDEERRKKIKVSSVLNKGIDMKYNNVQNGRQLILFYKKETRRVTVRQNGHFVGKK